ncbi:hypothetical protein QO004_002087 [Rhizobium mesoamericanum]|nr:hypothetical protein [Rhizobium mesoamericanum]MDQ0560305.1 hypothetical protein [Rhizobium mesoamericanum]
MTLQSLLLWFWSAVRIVPSQPRIELPRDAEPTARDYEIYYWNPSPGPWY